MPGQRAPLGDLHAVQIGLAEGEQDAHGDAQSTHENRKKCGGPQLLRYHTLAGGREGGRGDRWETVEVKIRIVFSPE